ncbi:two component transcriptional regulator, LuxR family [Roseomonas rosea]|uniref:Two component transcriptional regulator, LuxR family n=1 Tax=Muricoccus roseus TaxID=198092 RepID=A0A1M6DED9_9PROT|nr:response regulator [Roseomonas rosea]SHI71348.1 two component transcriptional regulator, LuxR family [Roseomonas rosea]
MRQRLILCVEDEADLRADIAEELRAAGYAVAEAPNGEAALARIAEAAPDLVLCDINMPSMDGFALLRRLREDRPDLADTPFLFLTALADRRDMVAGKEAGADDYLVKPIDYDVMLATIAARLRQVDRMRGKAAAEMEAARAAFGALARTPEATLPAPDGAAGAAAAALDRVALGVFLLGGDRRVSFVNRAGRAMLAEAEGLHLSPEGMLRGAAAAQTAALREAVEAVLSPRGSGAAKGGAGLALPRPSGRRPLTALVCPLRAEDGAAIALFVSDPERQPQLAPDVIAGLYGLTPAETRLAVALTQGQRLEEIAEAFGLSRSTLAYTLRNLFRKTETDRQADLVRLFLASPLAIGSTEA